MAQRKLSSNLKGELDINFNMGRGTVTEVVKDEEKTYDLFKILEEYNGTHVTISIQQTENIAPMDEDEFE